MAAACVLAEAVRTEGCENCCRRGESLPLFISARFDREAEAAVPGANRGCLPSPAGDEVPALAGTPDVTTPSKTAPTTAGRWYAERRDSFFISGSRAMCEVSGEVRSQ
jgi:hypothetical protein